MDKFTGAKQPLPGIFLFFSIFILLFFVSPVEGQVEYSKFFEFKEGIYLNFQQFRNNNPIPKSKIISENNKNDLSFLEDITSKKNIAYRDSSGKEQKIETSQLWGYSKNNVIHISFEGNFYRIGVIGSLCHFVASITTYVSTPDPFYSMRGYPYMMNSNMPVKELRQFVLDTQTNTILDFNTENMEVLLRKDETLYNEFMALKRKKKRESLFIYLRKYNEKHPLYFTDK